MPADSGGSASRICCVWSQHTASSGAPTSQRHATSRAVSEGCVKTQPIWPTADWVPRKRCSVATLLDHQVNRLAGNYDDLHDIFAGDARLHFFVGQGRGFDHVRRGTGFNTHHANEFAIDLHGDFEFVFAGERRITDWPRRA